MHQNFALHSRYFMDLSFCLKNNKVCYVELSAPNKETNGEFCNTKAM